MDGRRRRKVEHTDDWQELLSLFDWPEQEAYEELRPLVLFGDSVAERARETGTPERTMYRRMERFEGDGMASLLGSDPATHRAKRQGLEPAIRRMIVELKAEHPKLNNNEIKNIVYVRGGRRLGKHTAARVLSEEVLPLKLSRLFEPYHEATSRREVREAVVALHLDGWSVKAIASYLKVSRMTVYRVLGRWLEEGEPLLADKLPGRPKGVRKMDLATMDFIRRAQENPELGAFRVHAALEQKRGAEVSVRTVGRVMAVHRSLYGLGKPKRSPHQKKAMPFRAKRRHEIWSADVRYVDHNLPPEEHEGNVYAISILENYSRLILASAVSRTQDTTAFLRVLYGAVGRYGAPESGEARHRWGRHLQGQPGEVRLPGSRRGEGANRAGQAVAIVHRNNVQHSTPNGRFPLWRGRELDRTRRGARPLRGGLQRPEPLGAPGSPRRPQEPAGGVGVLHSSLALPRGRPREGVLLDPLLARARPFGLRPLQGLEAVRRGGARQKGRRHLAAAEEPHHRTRRRDALTLRRRTRARHG